MTTTERGEKHRARAVEYSRAQVSSVRDIGPPPNIVDTARRDDCRYDLQLFLETYFPRVFALKWSADHEMLLRETQRVILEGGQVCVAMPRGSGKTSIFQHSMIWASLYAHRLFTILLLADATNFTRLLSGIRTVMESSQLLLQDFPEVIHPIQKLERTATRANYQVCCGQATYIKWGTKAIQFPTTEWTLERGNAGVCLGGGGLTSSAIRGQVMSLPNGEQRRPSLALVDDPQTRAVARSEAQVAGLEEIIKADICGMSGPDGDMSLMMACTVIEQGDLADRLLDKNRNPQITGIRVSTIKRWPEHMRKWEEYSEIRRREYLEEVEEGSATAFYLKHQQEMDAGAVHYWPERKPPRFATALEASMAEYFQDPRSFMSERQNQPAADFDSEFVPLNPLELSRRVNKYARNEVPHDVQKITAFVDVQLRMLFWMVVGWTKDYGGYVMDYGTWPKVPRAHFSYRELKSPTLQTTYKAEDDDAIRMGICDLLGTLGSHEWTRKSDNASMRLDRGMIDCGYKYDVVESALIHGKLANTWLPYRGVGVGAKDNPIKVWRAQLRGKHWLLNKPQDRFLRAITADTNHWKSHVYDSLRVPVSHSAAITWFKGMASERQLLADHCTAEVAVRCEAKGRRVDEWELKPNKPDNHWWDCLVGNAVAANVCGIVRDKDIVRVPIRKKKKTLKV